MMLISTCQRDCGHPFLAPVLSIAQWHLWDFLFTKQWRLNYWGLVDRICRRELTAAWLACQSTLSAGMWSSVAVVTAPSVYLTDVFLRLTGESCTHWCCCFSILDYFLVLYLHFLLYYCNTVRWAWLDWGLSGWLTTLLQCFDTVSWVIRPVKTVGRITYIVLVQTLNRAQSMNCFSISTVTTFPGCICVSPCWRLKSTALDCWYYWLICQTFCRL